MNQNFITKEKTFFSKWASLVVLSLALAIIIIDTTLLNVSLGTLIRELHTTILSLQWVITAYALMLAALTITGGRLGDLFGRKKMFMLGAFIFAVGSFIASISNNIPTLLAGESFIEGIGAAMMMPATASLLVSTYRGRDRALAFGVWGGIAAAASAIGPLLGGYLTTHFSWRWGFRINVGVVALLLLGSFLIKESRDEVEKPNLDIFGVILSALGLASVVFGIIESSTYGWWNAKDTFTAFGHAINFGSISVTPFAIILGLILLSAFLLWEIHVEEKGDTPLVSLGIFKNRQFSSGAVTTMVLSLGQAGTFFALPIFVQAVLGYDAFKTGLTFLPMSIALLIMAPVAANLSHRITPKYLIQAGFLIDVIAAFVIRASLHVDATGTSLIPGLALYGLGMGLVMAPISNLTLSAVPVDQAGEASGVNNTLRQVGQSFGSAVIGAIVLTALVTNLQSGITGSAVIPEQVKPAISQAVAKQSSGLEFGTADIVQNQGPIADEMHRIVKQATADANRTSYLYGAFLIAFGFLVSFGLPKTDPAAVPAEASADTGAGTAGEEEVLPVPQPPR